MFLHTVKYKRKGSDGCYCSLMESYRDSDGKPVHKRVATLGFIPEDRVAFLKAAFSSRDPYDVLREEGALPPEAPSVMRSPAELTDDGRSDRQKQTNSHGTREK